jgi:2-polyprenyl-6-methoxyphenol hydroxylase-like FAD-dependent oxidoreductase
MSESKRVLISGAGIAGLTLAILLKERGWEPVVVERDTALRDEGYMMDFFGTGWDVAERMGLESKLRGIKYPIDSLQFVEPDGAVYASVPIDRIRRALDGKYTYLRRSDLERILYDRALAAGVIVNFGREVEELEDRSSEIRVRFNDGNEEAFALAFGADGVHSRLRQIVFGDARQFEHFLGGYVAAFHLDHHSFDLDRALKFYEEPDRVAAFYPLDDMRMAATYSFRHAETRVPPEERLDFVRKVYAGSGWLAEAMLGAYQAKEPLYFDTLTQIVMPQWRKGRVALLGDACGCLTLIAGQGSHMAMAGAYVLARELERHAGKHAGAFAAYEALLKPVVTRKQKDAASFERFFIPSRDSWPWLRRLVIKAMFSPLLLPLMFRWFGARSALHDYA